MQQRNIVVLGYVITSILKANVRLTYRRAGVSGLTTALLLSRNRKYNITIIAKHMPGDYDIEYASPCQYLMVIGCR